MVEKRLRLRTLAHFVRYATYLNAFHGDGTHDLADVCAIILERAYEEDMRAGRTWLLSEMPPGTH